MRKHKAKQLPIVVADKKGKRSKNTFYRNTDCVKIVEQSFMNLCNYVSLIKQKKAFG